MIGYPGGIMGWSRSEAETAEGNPMPRSVAGGEEGMAEEEADAVGDHGDAEEDDEDEEDAAAPVGEEAADGGEDPVGGF